MTKETTKRHYGTGADKSKFDIRTFGFVPTKANKKGGERYKASDIEDQHRVGICTAISVTQNARKFSGKKYSADFQYLLQKKYHDGNWNEGSSALSALKTAHKYGFLPDKEFQKFITEDDRKLTYSKYIKKLQAISDDDIQELLGKTEKIMSAYAKVPTDRDSLALAIDESQTGLIVRFVVGSEWWTPPIEPLRFPKRILSGHLTIHTNYDGGSFRIANTWGSDWADKGTAYHLLRDNPVTEAWIPYYENVPDPIKEQQKNREKVVGQILDYLQKIIVLVQKLI